jgi:hypothetical protein
MPTLDETTAQGLSDLDVADVGRVADQTVDDPLNMLSELMTSSPGGMWANRVSALLAYLMHVNNGDDQVRFGTSDSFATQDNGGLIRVSGTTALLRNAADSAYLAIRPASILLGTGGQTITPVTGSPEGALTAVVGSLAVRTDGGADTTLYVKESGTGNTGWVAK